MDVERRKHPRVPGPFEGSWRGASGGLSTCRIENISLGGVYIQSLVAPSPGEDTVVTVQFADEISISLKGHVVYADSGMGFAVEFEELSPDVIDQLRHLLSGRAGGPAEV